MLFLWQEDLVIYLVFLTAVALAGAFLATALAFAGAFGLATAFAGAFFAGAFAGAFLATALTAGAFLAGAFAGAEVSATAGTATGATSTLYGAGSATTGCALPKSDFKKLIMI